MALFNMSLRAGTPQLFCGVFHNIFVKYSYINKHTSIVLLKMALFSISVRAGTPQLFCWVFHIFFC
jgi:hypothetical protein